MNQYAHFCFYHSLNDFLPVRKRNSWISYLFTHTPSVKDAIEAIGVPHPEIDIILINDLPATFSSALQPEDWVKVYPVNKEKDWPSPDSLQTEPPTPLKFILDVHLGKLTKALRMLGFDTYYEKDYEDKAIATIADRENRIVLTRDIGLLKHKIVKWGYWLRSQHLEEQLAEIIAYYGLKNKFKPFTRCLACNNSLKVVDKEKVWHELPPKTKLYFNEFYRCLHCQRVYWQGSHYDNMLKFINRVT